MPRSHIMKSAIAELGLPAETSHAEFWLTLAEFKRIGYPPAAKLSARLDDELDGARPIG